MMKRIAYLLLILFIWSCTESTNAPPNIVLVFTDDQGYGDLSCYGSETISTPNIDALAAAGMKFTDFHVSSSVCSPSRVSLLTGCYPLRVGVPGVLFPNGAWGSKPNVGLNPDEQTVAELLKGKGYVTAMAGKWHLGHRPMFLPINQGFDDYFGIPFSNDMTIVPSMKLAEDVKFRNGWTEEDILTINDKPWEVRRGNPPLMKNDEVIEVPVDQNTLTKRYTQYSVDFINRNAGNKPFFLYLAHTMPHIQLYASEEFRGTSKGGLYGDVIEEIDWSVAEIVKALKENGVYENTLIIFTSDNGPWLSYGNHGGSAGGLRGGKFDSWEGGFRVPAIMSWPKTIPAGSINDQFASTLDILPTLLEITEAKSTSEKIDGMSILPMLKGEQTIAEDRYFYYFNRERLDGVRKGKWKYVFAHKGGVVTEPGIDGVNGKTDWEVEFPEALYDLDKDVAESDNLIDAYGVIALELKAAGEDFDKSLKKEARPVGVDETYEPREE